MASRSYNVKLTSLGGSPLLMHADDIDASDELMAWRKDPNNKKHSTPGDDRSPAWTWQSYVYTDGERVTIPADNVMACLRKGAASVTLKGQKSFKEISQSGMILQEEFCNFTFDNGKTLTVENLENMRHMPFPQQSEAAEKLGFKLFKRRARVRTNKHVRVRPRFDSWQISATLIVRAEELTHTVISQIFDQAGNLGIGDWRPGCSTPGRYGMFTAKITAN